MNIYGFTFSMLETYLSDRGIKASKVAFIAKSLYRYRILSFNDINEINKEIKSILDTNFEISLLEIAEICESDDSIKLLFKLHDSNLIEAVVMRQKYGNTLCISTQVGCNMGCKFCQSGRQKKNRDLETWEMTAQVISIQQKFSIKISNVVLMGMGEPFDNYNNVMNFISILNNPYMLGIGKNHISVSTCGIIPKIYDYISHPNCCLLAVSLHAPDDALRSKLMPVNEAYSVAELMKAVDAYIGAVNKKVFLEYVMIKEVNDTAKCALNLVNLIKDRRCHVNLIPYNETQNPDFSKSSHDQIMKFYDILKKNNISVTMRKVFGASSNSACGQLRANYKSNYQAP